MASNTFDSFKKYASSYIDVIIYAYEINFLKISRQLLEVLTVGRKSAAPASESELWSTYVALEI